MPASTWRGPVGSRLGSSSTPHSSVARLPPTRSPVPRGIQAERARIRRLTVAEFVERHASGTLRKNRRLGMNVSSHLLQERIAFEFGYGFECLPERFVTWGEARSEGECPALTEAGWHIDRYAHVCLVPGDEIETKYLIVETDGARRWRPAARSASTKSTARS